VESGAAPSPGLGIRTRGEAYMMVSQAADYVLHTEPHSPAPYLVKRAVSWGTMSLTELLQEIVSTKSEVQGIYGLLGVKEALEEAGKKK
jgi:type VI secretion system protein ImpA